MMRLQIGPHDLEIGDTRFGLTRREHGIDVVVHHPLFAEMPEEPRLRIAFLCHDWALGEQAVEVWVGEISAAPTAPAQLDTVDGLRSAVAELAAQHREPQWVILRGGESDGATRLAAATSGWRGARCTTTPDPGLAAIRHLDADR